jgi:hypothetical protein
MTEKSKVREEEWRVRERDLEEALLKGEKDRLALKDNIYLLESQLRDSSLQTDGVQVFCSPPPPSLPLKLIKFYLINLFYIRLPRHI